MTQRKTPAKSPSSKNKAKAKTKAPAVVKSKASAKAVTAKSNGSAKKTAKTNIRSEINKNLLRVSHNERLQMIAEAAYYRSLNGSGSDEVNNWLKAEMDIDQQVML